MLMLLGILAVASAERHAAEHAFARLSWSRSAIPAGGVAIYCFGNLLFRRELSLGRTRRRMAAAVMAIATAPIGA